MRVVTWNASRRGATSASVLDELRPDVAVLPEWAKLPMKPPDTSTSFVEFGTVGKLGVGVAAWGDWTVRAARLPPIGGVVVGGVEVDGPSPFRLVAVWAYLSDSPKVNPVMEALEAWGDWLSKAPVVVAGDFNTGGWWRHIADGPKSHFPIVDALTERGLQSAYHAVRDLEQGVDEEPTHWHSGGKAYMIDHVFVPRSWTIDSVLVGAEDPWRERSDHAPVIVDVTA